MNRGVKFSPLITLGFSQDWEEISRGQDGSVSVKSRVNSTHGKRTQGCNMILVQLNRDAEGVEPTLSMLRDSGSIEQDADKIVFLWSREDEDKNAQLRQ